MALGLHPEINREKATVRCMVALFCHNRHARRLRGDDGLCQECRELVDYAHRRLENCRFGDTKGSCRQCSVHCYSPAMAEAIRRVMRYSGPRMMFHHPIAAIRHLLAEL